MTEVFEICLGKVSVHSEKYEVVCVLCVSDRKLMWKREILLITIVGKSDHVTKAFCNWVESWAWVKGFVSISDPKSSAQSSCEINAIIFMVDVGAQVDVG
jgi:hypothetical protein